MRVRGRSGGVSGVLVQVLDHDRLGELRFDVLARTAFAVSAGSDLCM